MNPQPISFDQAPAPVVDVEVKPVAIPVQMQQPASLPVVATSQAVVVAKLPTDDEIDKLGKAAGQKTAAITSKILGSVKATDTDQFGIQLNELVSQAKKLDPKAMKPGLIGKLFGAGAGLKEKLLAQYQTVEQRMNELEKEMANTVGQLKGRIGDLEQMFEDNYQAYRALEADVALADQQLAEIQAWMDAQGQATDSFAAQHLADARDRYNRLAKRQDDMKRGMQLSMLAAPEIRMMQGQNRSLITSFNDIQTTTLPAWKSVFSRYIIAMEAKKAAQLQDTISEATNVAFRMQADQVRENAVAIATAQQKSLVTIETLTHMQQQLIGAVDDAKRINDEGAAARRAALPQLQSLETELIARFSPPKLTNGS